MRPLPGRLAIRFLPALLALLAFASPASALTFGDPGRVSPSGEIVNPNGSGNASLAMDSAGDAIVVWTKYSTATGDCPCTVRAATRTAGNAFGPAVDVSKGGNAEGGDAHAAMDSTGDALVAWTDSTGASPEWKTMVSTRPAGGSFSDPQQISGAATTTKGGEVDGAAMDAAGDAIVAWEPAGTNTYPRQIAVSRRPSGGSFTAPADIDAGNDIKSFGELAMSPDGHAAIVFEHRDICPDSDSSCTNPDGPGETQNVQVVRAAPGAAFGAPVKVSSDVTVGIFAGPSPLVPNQYPSTASIDDANDVLVTWADVPTSPGQTTPNAATSDAGGAFTHVTLGSAGGSYGFPAGRISSSGASTVLWGDNSTGHLNSNTRSQGGSFSAASQVAGSADDFTLAESSNASGASGDALAAFAGGSGDAQTISAALSSPGGAFAVTPVGPTDANYVFGSIHAAIDKTGDAGAVAWVDDGGVKVSLAPGTRAPAKHTLHVTKSGAGHGVVSSAPAGINCGSTCSAQFNSGAAVKLTATPAAGSKFAGWSGGGCSGTAPCTVTLGADRSVTASFVPRNDFTLGTPKTNSKAGTAKLPAVVPGPGTLVLTGKGVKKVSKQATQAGTVKLAVTPTGALKRKLKKKHHASVTVTVVYTPTGGSANPQTKLVKLVKK